MKKGLTFLLLTCLSISLLCGCGASDNDAGNEDVLQEYTAEGVGVFHLPEGFEIKSGEEEEPLPMTWAELTKDDITVTASRFGSDAYEAAGVPMPENIEEYSQRDGVKQGLPEGTEFSKNGYGDLFVTYTNEDGTVVYSVLKKGAESYGTITVYFPEGTESAENAALWISQCTLE